MSEIYRASFSLEFTDEKLYNELILPLKQKKRLKHLVVGLLEKYFYDEEFYNMFESSNGVTEDSIVHNYDEYFKDISAYVAILGSMQDTMEENVKEGLQNILDTAEGREDIDEEVWGRGVPRIADNMPKLQEKKEEADSGKIQQLESQIENLTNLVTSLMGTGVVQPMGQQVVISQQPMIQQPMVQPTVVQQPQITPITQQTPIENMQVNTTESTTNVVLNNEPEKAETLNADENIVIQQDAEEDDDIQIVFTDESENDTTVEIPKGDAKKKLGKLVASLNK